MSVVIYTYHEPYLIDKEDYWDRINSCPYFCVSQTLVNGLCTHYGVKKYEQGRVMTVQHLTNAMFEEWVSTERMVRQHADIDNVINNELLSGLDMGERQNILNAFLLNRDEVFQSIRILFELKVDIHKIARDKLTREQGYIVDIYQHILDSNYKKDFFLKNALTEKEVNEGLIRAMTSINKQYDYSAVNLDRVVIHGVHQFSPIILRTIEEIARFKEVILLFNYQKQYKNLYQTWIDIYSAFECTIEDYDRNEFVADDPRTVSYQGNVLADQMGKLIEGRKKEIRVQRPYEILEFDNVTEFAGYVAGLFDSAKHIDPLRPMQAMSEQIYAADSSVNNILKIYFPEQFGEREFLNYPLGHFFLALANMWDSEENTLLITDMNDIRECLSAGILEESKAGELNTIFGQIQSLFDGCTTIQQMKKRLEGVRRSRRYIPDTDVEERLNRISYYAVSRNDIEKLEKALREIEDLGAHFYEDFERKENNFREFYKKMKHYLQTDVLDLRELSEEFRDIIQRVLTRLDEVDDVNASASFSCLKATMSIYLSQEKRPEKSANWIVRNFEQIDGDILRSGHGNKNTVYHFACLSDEEIGAAKKREFPWPLNDDFFEVAQNPVDWKYQVYVKSCKEYKNFKRYALIYGLEFNRARYKLSYVKRDGVSKREPYYLLKLLGLKWNSYRERKTGTKRERGLSINLALTGASRFDKFDYYRFKICPYRFLLESLIEEATIYKDNFLQLKYMEVLLANRVREALRNVPISEWALVQKLEEEYEELQTYFPFAQTVNRIDVIHAAQRRVSEAEKKQLPMSESEERKDRRIQELFIHNRLVNYQRYKMDVFKDKFPDVSREQLEKGLSKEKILQEGWRRKTDLWCKYCANREICIAYYCRKD